MGVAGPAVEFPFRGWVAAVEGEQHRVGAGPGGWRGAARRGSGGPRRVCRRRGRRRCRCWRRGARRSGSPSCGSRRGARGEVSVPRPAPRRGVGQQPQGEQAAGHRVAVREIAVDVGTPGLPAVFVGRKCHPGRLGVDIDQRFAVGDAEREGDGPTGRDRNLTGRPASRRSGGDARSASAKVDQLHTTTSPRCSTRGEVWCSPRRGSNSITASTGPSAAVSRRTSRLDGNSYPVTSAIIASVRVSRPPGVSQVVSRWRWPVAAGDDRGRSGWPHAEGARRRPADQAAEHRGPSKRGRTASRWRRRSRQALRCGCHPAGRSPRWGWPAARSRECGAWRVSAPSSTPRATP